MSRTTTVERTLATRVGTLVLDRKKELLVTAGLAAGAFALGSLVGAHPTDPTVFSAGTGRVENPLGLVGAHLAWVLQHLFGIGAWTLLAPMVAGVLVLAGRNSGSMVRWIAATTLVGAVLGLAHLAFGPGDVHAPGGLFGWALAESLRFAFGTVGAVLVLFAWILAAATVVGHIRWSRVARWVVDKLEIWVPKAAAFAIRALRVGLAGSGWVLRRVFRAMAWVVGLGVRGVGGALRAVGLRSGDAVRRIGASLGRGLSTDPGVWQQEDLPSVPDFDDDDEPDLGPTRSDTVVGGFSALVELEWEPTVAAFVEEDVDEPAPAAAHAEGEMLGLFPDFAPRGVYIPPPTVLDPTDPPAPPAHVRPRHQSPVPEGDFDDDDLDDVVAGPPSIAVPVPTKPARPSDPGGKAGFEVHRGVYLDLRVKDDGKGLGKRGAYELPALKLLDVVPEQRASFDEGEMRRLARVVEETLLSFKIGGSVTAVRPGPVVTIFEFEPDAGIKVSRVASLADDLAMALKALRVRIVAPIPGRGCIGIEIPSERRLMIYLRELLASDEFRSGRHALPVIIGKDVGGAPVVEDLASMPHLLIGGTTGSGKSVGVNGMLMSLLYARTPEELRLLLIDPKMLEFELYDGIPHLLHPVITEPKGAAAALQWACREMDRRYAILAAWGTRNIKSYNKKVEAEMVNWTSEKARRYLGDRWQPGEELPLPERFPYIVVVIDELADLMMLAGKEVEEGIVRIAQKARASGIHLIVATQRPSVDVVTGLIKANLPTRISFQLRTKIDSRTVLDQSGAESLLGRGDLLFLPPGVGDLQRCHCAFVSDEEVARVMDYLRAQGHPDYIPDVCVPEDRELDEAMEAEKDDLYWQAVELCVQQGKASTSMIQRHLKIGYNRAARMIDIMEAGGIVGPADGARPRDVLVKAVPDARA